MSDVLYCIVCVCMELHLSYYQWNMFATCAAHDVQTNNNLLLVRICFSIFMFFFGVRCFAPPVLSIKPDFRRIQWKRKNQLQCKQKHQRINFFSICLNALTVVYWVRANGCDWFVHWKIPSEIHCVSFSFYFSFNTFIGAA